jgi:hypothetical protein
LSGGHRTPLDIKELFPDLDEEKEHSLVYVRVLWQSDDDQIMRLEGGESVYMPPVPFVRRLSLMFPDMVFHVGGTTEHELYELYEVKAGEERLLDKVVTDLQHNITTVYARDGVELDPPEVSEEDDEDEMEIIAEKG